MISVLASCFVIANAMVAAGSPALPGFHPLTDSQAGDVLIAELRCAACHAGVERRSLPEKAAPDLAEAGSRISPEYLRRFLAAPASVHPGTTMPDVLATQPEAERKQIAEALTHFLVAQSKLPFDATRSVPDERDQGKTLFHSVGCVACHGPREALAAMPPVEPEDEEEDENPRIRARNAIKPIAVTLGHVADKYSVKSLSEFLFQPLRVRSSGRMPDMKLTPAEALAIASYLAGDQTRHDQALAPMDSLVAKGREYFRQLNCAACHSLPDTAAGPLGKSLKGANLSRGCLSKAEARSPRFQLEDTQVKAIVAALQEKPQSEVDQVVIAKTMTAFRCIACHVRDDYGGVPEAYNPYFLGSEQKLGDDGRIPPPLTLIGAKLQPAWFKKVLFDGESVRQYMRTRMPQYGSANLQHLPAILARLDVLHGKALNVPSPEARSESDRNREKALRAGGRELLGDKGLNCVACHEFNGKAAPGSQGIDLITTTQRLQPGWFNSYLRNPGAFRPRTVMPSAWPNGVASHKTILDGDTDTQIEAIWYYLSLGTSAADPSGIWGVSTKLTVEDQAKTYRGRSKVAGYRGIAVGLPEKLSYAFNAETGTLSAIWQGDFIGVNWSGQGSGEFNPASEAITLPQNVSFAQLADENADWPLLPVMTKEAKTNPDPLYPKNVGYQFRGYFLGEKSIPTFLYRSGTIEVEDRSVAVVTAEQTHLKRVLNLESPAKQTVWLRALVGDAWGYANYHEYAFGSKLDAEGNQFVALGLSESYYSHALNRGFIMKIAPDGKTTAYASGLRSPGGIGFDEHRALFYVESQGPWNCSCSLKAVAPKSFHGHPASFNWYKYAPELGPVPEAPKSGTRIADERKQIQQLTPYAVIFPYIRMGRSITGFSVNQTQGKFGPFENQLFLGDYTQSILMRATTEQVNGVWQGACYPFREGLSTGILNVEFTPGGKLLCGGTNRGWPVRGIKPFALERLEWSGKLPFEIDRITIEPDGFKITFTKPVAPKAGIRASFVPVIVSVTGTNEERPSQIVAVQQFATGVKEISGEDRIRTCGTV